MKALGPDRGPTSGCAVHLNGQRFGWVDDARARMLQCLPNVSMGSKGQGLHLAMDDVTSGLAALHDVFARDGLITGWRDELIDVLDWSGTLRMGVMERAAARFWGSHTRAVHLNGWVGRHEGDRELLLWLAQRSSGKAVDPGRWDNLVAGGIGVSEKPDEALRREALEEAGLDLDIVLRLDPAPRQLVEGPVPEGWQRETLLVFDAWLPKGFSPRNRDGEVQAFECLTTEAAWSRARAGRMTADAAQVTLDFLSRRMT